MSLCHSLPGDSEDTGQDMQLSLSVMGGHEHCRAVCCGGRSAMHIRVFGSHRDGGGEEKVTSVQLSEVGSSYCCYVFKKYQVPPCARSLLEAGEAAVNRTDHRCAGDASPSSGAPSSGELAGTEVKGRAPGGGKGHPMACTDGPSTAQPPCTQGLSAQASSTCPQSRLWGGFLRTTDLGLWGVGPWKVQTGKGPGAGAVEGQGAEPEATLTRLPVPPFPWVRGHLHSVSRGQVSGGQ